MSSPLLIEKTQPGSNFLWKIITSKWIAKYTCLGITLLLLLISGLMLYQNFGAFFLPDEFYYDMFIGQHFRQILEFYSIIEGLILILGIYGVFAVLTENTTFLKLYGLLTFFTFILTAVTGGTMVATAFQKIPETYNRFTDLMDMYELDNDAKMTIIYIQNEKQCCGYYGASDWLDHLTANTFRNFSDFIAPKSCCYDEKCTSYNTGCEKTIKLIMVEAIVEVLKASSVLSILFLLAVIATLRLKQKIEESKEVHILPKVLVGAVLQPELKTVVVGSENTFYDYSQKVLEFSNFLHQNGINTQKP